MDPAAREAAAREIVRVARGKRPRSSRALIAAATIVTAGCVVAVVVGLARAPVPAAAGQVAPTQRATAALPAGGIAVVEAGAAIAWRDNAVTQTRGEVFYRIAGPLEITSPQVKLRAETACVRIVIGSSGTTVAVEQGVARVADRVIVAGDRVTIR
jgi:hypothetical protein